MPNYFIHITEGELSIPDPEGIERADVRAIRDEAIKGASSLIADAVRKGVRDYRGRLDVEDERGAKVLTVAFACPVHIEVIEPG